MAVSVTHSTVATLPDEPGAEINKAEWNAAHSVSGLGALAELNTVGSAQIDAAAVTYAKIQNVSATDKLLGRSTAGAGVVEEITCTAAGRALLDDAAATDQRTTLGVGTGDTPTFSGVVATNAVQAGTQLRISTDAILERDAANALGMRNGVNAQSLNVYNTYTSATNYEKGGIRWSGNILELGAEAGAGGGTLRSVRFSAAAIAFNTAGSARWNIANGGGFVAATHNTYDIGDSAGLTQPRTVYAATSMVCPTATAGTNSTVVATTAYAVAAAPNSSYRVILDSSGSLTAASAAGTYGFGQGIPVQISGTGTAAPANTIYIAAADFPTVNSLTTKLRVRAQVHCNDVAPAVTFTFGLHPITRPATSGAAGVVIYTIGAAVASSTVAITTPAADSSNVGASADFAIPADGHYVLGVVTSGGALAASSHVHMSVALQLRNT